MGDCGGGRLVTLNSVEATMGLITVSQSAVFARELVNNASIGTMATVYPADHATLAGMDRA